MSDFSVWPGGEKLLDIAEQIEREMGERIKRPQVLAADGEPLEVGQTVYGIGRTQHRFVVRAVSDYEEDETDGRFCVPCIDKDDGDEECWCDPSQLTHERTVLDADGVPIKVGDTVYVVGEFYDEEYDEYTVTSVHTESGRTPIVMKNRHNGFNAKRGNQLTHTKPEPPDSWERIEYEATIPPAFYCQCKSIGGDDSMSASERMAIDLVRRCKALAGVSE